MKKITSYSKGWCEIDQIGGDSSNRGYRIKDGDSLRVTFPDGSVKGIKAFVTKRFIDIPEQATTYPHEHSKAYHKTWWCGVPVEVPLIGLMAEIVLEKK